MAAPRNPYFVNVVRQTNGANSTHLGDQKMIEALAVRLEDTKLFNESAADMIRFAHDGNLATKDRTGVYKCYFLENGILLFCTTRIKPTRGGVNGIAIEIHSTAMPRLMMIPLNSTDVLWHISARK